MYRSRWQQLIMCIGIALVQPVILVPVNFFYKRLIDVSIPQRNAHEIVILGAIAFLLFVINFGVATLARYLTLKTTKSVIYEIRSRVCTKLQELCMSYYDNSNVGNLHARAMIDTEAVDVASNAMVVNVFTSATSFVIALIILIHMNWILTLVIVATMPLLYISRQLLKKSIKESYRDFRDQRESLSTGIHDMLSTIRLVKVFGMESFEEKKIQENIRGYLHSGIKSSIISNLFGNLVLTIGGLGAMAVWVVGAFLVVKGQMTIGSVVLFAGLQAYLINPINQLANLTEMIYSGSVALESVYDLLDEDDVEFPDEGHRMGTVRGDVAFDNVRFEYADGTCALQDISFCAQPGQQIALVGESGSGKSTLIHLILGLYLPTKGSVLIDGHDITKLDLRSLRQQMGMVSQETILINGTVKDNIRYGTPDANDEAVVDAAKLASAHDFVSKLPEGCGEDGVRLSGGQRQRIAIARALLRDPKILILDEATSALDSESEMQVQNAMEVLRKNRTTFVIAHRLSTILSSDFVFVMKRGRIAERGTHGELLAMNGVYTRLYNTQFKRDQLH